MIMEFRVMAYTRRLYRERNKGGQLEPHLLGVTVIRAEWIMGSVNDSICCDGWVNGWDALLVRRYDTPEFGYQGNEIVPQR